MLDHSITSQTPSSPSMLHPVCLACSWPVAFLDSQGRCLDCARAAADEEWRVWWQRGKL